MSQSRKRVKILGGFERAKCWQQANEFNMIIECQDTGRALTNVHEDNELENS